THVQRLSSRKSPAGAEYGASMNLGARRMARPGGAARLKSRVLAIVVAIPEGRVTTYGAIGKYLHTAGRQVGFVLANLTVEESDRLPWFRVVAANGIVSTSKVVAAAAHSGIPCASVYHAARYRAHSGATHSSDRAVRKV